MRFLDWLKGRLEGPGLSTEDVLASALPLVRQTLDVHRAGRVAPLKGVDHLNVEGVRLWFEAGQSREPLLAAGRLSEIQKPQSLAFDITARGEVTDALAEGESTFTDQRIGKAGATLVAPVYMPGYVGWEHDAGHHDPVTDVFSLGMILASLALGLDFTDAKDLQTFVAGRGNLFKLRPDLHPVLAKAIVRMTELDRHARAQDLEGLLHTLENHRDQAVDVSFDLARGLKTGDRRRELLERLRERLFEISRRNRLLYHRPSLNALNLTIASVPLLFDARGLRPEQLLSWSSDFAKHLLSGEAIPLGRYLRFEDAPYIKGVLDHILAESRRDQAEFGFSQVRLVLCFLRWHNLKEAKEERIESPLVLLPVQLSRKKGVRDAYLLQAPTTEAEINPVLRFHLREVYGINLPETIDLSETTLDELHEDLAKLIQASEPGVTLNRIDKPPLQLIHEKARRRLDQYQRRLDLRGRSTRSFEDMSYSYDPENFAPLGLKLFQTRVRPSRAPLGDLVADAPRPREFAVADGPADEKSRLVGYIGQPEQNNPYAWDFDLCSITLGNFKYRKMSLVRDYDALIGSLPPNRGFDSIFSLAPRPPAEKPEPVPPLEKRHPVVPCDPTQAASIAQAATGRSFIIQGPPGTGKSQTITNLIADYVAAGKRVLFVCEKRAAIDVVYQRLKQQGLDDLCTLIHDSQQDKKAFIQDLKKTYEGFLGESAKEEIDWPARRDQILGLIRKELEPLERFDAAMRAAPESVGVPLRQLLQRRVELAGVAPAPKTGLPDYAAWIASRDAVDRLVAALREVESSGVFSRHPLSLLSPRVLKEESPPEFVTARVEEVRNLVHRIVATLKEAALPEAGTLDDVGKLVKFAESVRFLAESGRYALADAQSEARQGLMRRVLELRGRHEALDKQRTENKRWKQKLPKEEVGPALDLARTLTGFFSFLKPAWWRLRGILNARYEFGLHVVKPTWAQVLESLKLEHELEDAYDAAEKAARAEYGISEPLEEYTRRVVAAGQAAGALLALVPPDRASNVIPQLAGLREPLDALARAVEGFLAEPGARTLSQLEDDVDRIEESIDLLPDFLPCLAELERMPPALAEAFRRIPADAAQLEAGMADRGLEHAYLQDRALARFGGSVRERHLSRLERLHREWQDANAKTLRTRVRDRFLEKLRVKNKAYATGRKELEREFEKTMRYRSIRDLSDDETGLVIADLKPVWLMSPLSVSDTQPLATKNFDVVIFDEASQIPLEEGVPAIFRAEQAIIVGDQMQLPPTSFFSSRGPDEDLAEEDGAAPAEYDLSSNSFLAFAARTLPSTMLGWHYRSRSESLISFSNARFYEGRLMTVPESTRAGDAQGAIAAADPKEGGPNCSKALDRAMSFHFLEKGVYDQRRNAAEAEYIAHLVRALLAGGSKLSVGVVAFSEAQQGEIESALEALARTDPEFRDRLEREVEREEDGQFLGLLVKNLENIQGDERDFMILSVCYGKGPDGRMLMNFGPINQGGGEKRLNVAFSRAKRHMAVVSSIRAIDITNDYNDGANCLRNYLRYVEAVSSGDARSAGRVLDEIQLGRGKAESKAGADAVADQLAKELVARGYEVDAGVGHSGLKCDLAVRRKGERNYLAAVLVDTLDGYRDVDVLSRDLMRPALLRSFGWRVQLVLTKDWQQDRAGVLNRLEKFLRGEAEAEEALDLPAAPTRAVGKAAAPDEPAPKPEVAPASGPPVTTGVRKFEFVEGGSAKFWEIGVEGSRTTVRFGRIGTAGQSLTKEFGSATDAARDADRLVREKLAKGYKEKS